MRMIGIDTHHIPRARVQPILHTMKLSEALRELGHPVAYYPVLAKVFGVQESIFIAQFVYWTGKERSGDGWIYKSAEEIQGETGLTYEQQQRIRKVLGSSSRFGVRGKRVRRVHIEPVIEERYERPEHKMYFRVNFEALDRAFSENLFSDLHSGSMGLFPDSHLGKAQESTWVIPRSSIQRLPTETTELIARKNAHKNFVKWWNETTLSIRKVKVRWTPADFRNLKIILTTVDPEKLEQLALYFLADSKFRKYTPTLRVFLSKGVMDALKKAQTYEGFWDTVYQYASRYLLHNAIATEKEFMNLTNTLAEKFGKKISVSDDDL